MGLFLGICLLQLVTFKEIGLDWIFCNLGNKQQNIPLRFMILDWKPAEEIVFAVAEDGARCESSSVTVAGKTVKLPDV